MTDTTYYSFQTERHEGADHIHAIECFASHKKPCSGPSDRFELSEPVYVKDDAFNPLYAPTRVFWIARITVEFEDHDEIRVHLTLTRDDKRGDTWVHPTALRKLPAMLRIALEADLP